MLFALGGGSSVREKIMNPFCSTIPLRYYFLSMKLSLRQRLIQPMLTTLLLELIAIR
jgi:hypothetical protein